MESNEAEKVTCNRDSCVHYRGGYCTFKNPECNGDYCLHYEDTLDSLRLKADAFKGTLRR